MGSAVPASDQKLGRWQEPHVHKNKQLTDLVGAIEHHGECNINTASDFIAQYTTRQEYRYADVLPGYEQEWTSFLHFGN